jgi:RNA polymerase sigma-70 factor (ECF subfamily)
VTSGDADRELVSRLRRSQPGAFDELYRRYREKIWRFLRQLSGSTEAAEDLFQDTWLAAARHAHRLEEDTVLSAWLYTIARNKHRNALRWRMFYEERLARARTQPVEEPSQPDVETERRARARNLAAAFSRLAEAHREILLLSVGEALDTMEIAKILDLRAEAVRKRLSRARAELQRHAEVHPMKKDRIK